jgi:hypothetical protein
MLGWLLLRWRTPRLDMTATSTLVTHGSFRSLSICLPLNLPMWALRFDVPKLTTVMACGRLSSNRKLENPPFLHMGPRRQGIFLPPEFLLPSQTHR